MGYTPSISDIPASGGYTPSANDIPSAPGNMAQISSVLSGQNPQAVQSQLSSMTGTQSPNFQAAKTLASGAAGLTAGMAGGAVAGLPGEMAGWGGYGAATNPQTPISSGLEYGMLPLAGAVASSVPGAIKSGIDLLTGKNLDNAAGSLYKTISQGLAPDELNEINNKNVINDYRVNQANAAQQYNNISNQALSRGYASSGQPGIAGIDANTDQKFITPQNTNNTLLDLTPRADTDPQQANNQAQLNTLSPSTRSLIQRYSSSPTYMNAHLLQSQLGQEASNLRYMGNATPIQLETASSLDNAREGLRSDIMNSFAQNGDSDLAAKYQQATDLYRKTVVPYMETPPIWNAINGKKFPNITNVLSGDDNNGYLQFIRNQAAQSPQVGNTILAQALRSSGKLDALGDYSTKAKNLLESASNLPANIREMIPSDTNNLLGQLQNNVGLRQKLTKFAAWGTGVGSAVGFGHHLLHGD